MFLDSLFDDPTSSLLEVGDPNNSNDATAAAGAAGAGAGRGGGSRDPGDPANPTVLSDVFARVGGSDFGDAAAHTMVRLHTGNVVGDNLWLWRADHTALRPGEVSKHATST